MSTALTFLSPFAALSIASLLSISAIGAGIMAVAMRPSHHSRTTGRSLAYQSLVCGVLALPLYLYAAPGTNITGSVYVVALITVAISVAVMTVYIRRR